MFLRPHHRDKDGKRHTYWTLVETMRTVDGPRQRTLCHLGEHDSAQARWLKTIDVFNDAGERHQLKLFPSDITLPPDDAEVAQVLVQRVRFERTRQLGPALSRQSFSGAWLVDGWLHTGDGGHLDGAYAVITDRKKDVIITGGENVSSIEVEDCLYQHVAVAEAAVIGVPHDKWGETVLAFVVLRPGSPATAGELIAHCRSRLSHFKCPTAIELRDALPRTATGKLQKFRLREPYWAGRDRGVS